MSKKSKIDHNAVYRMSWTWNKQDNHVYEEGEFEAFHTIIKSNLETLCPKSKFVFQLEKGTEAGRLHYQGHINLNTKERITTFANRVQHFMPGIHVSETSNAGEGLGEFYCMKEDTRVAGPWADKEYIFPDFSEYNTELTGWCAMAKELLLQPPELRTVYWVYEEQGCKGKTYFSNYMELKHGACSLSLGTARDNFYIVSEFIRRIYIFDVPRSLPNNFDWNDVYTSLEKIKDRNFASTKFKPKKVFLPVVPHILVLSNYPPDLTKLSIDRWKVFKIIDDVLFQEYPAGLP